MRELTPFELNIVGSGMSDDSRKLHAKLAATSAARHAVKRVGIGPGRLFHLRGSRLRGRGAPQAFGSVGYPAPAAASRSATTCSPSANAVDAPLPPVTSTSLTFGAGRSSSTSCCAEYA